MTKSDLLLSLPDLYRLAKNWGVQIDDDKPVLSLTEKAARSQPATRPGSKVVSNVGAWFIGGLQGLAASAKSDSVFMPVGHIVRKTADPICQLKHVVVELSGDGHVLGNNLSPQVSSLFAQALFLGGKRAIVTLGKQLNGDAGLCDTYASVVRALPEVNVDVAQVLLPKAWKAVHHARLSNGQLPCGGGGWSSVLDAFVRASVPVCQTAQVSAPFHVMVRALHSEVAALNPNVSTSKAIRSNLAFCLKALRRQAFTSVAQGD